MKISVAQISSVAGDIGRNISRHKELAHAAVRQGAELIVFPELSLTGYEPRLARNLAVKAQDDPRLEELQIFSNKHDVCLAAGVPTQTKGGVAITLLLFQPGQKRIAYSKKHLHPDEESFFTSGESIPVIPVRGKAIAFAICYEISVFEHADTAFRRGAEIYIASVAKFQRGIAAAIQKLSEIAREYFVPVLMSNAVGVADGEVCAGRSSVWRNGKLAGQLGDSNEGFLIFDSESLTVTSRQVP